MTTTHQPSPTRLALWQQMIILEPRLLALHERAKAAKVPPDGPCPFTVWYQGGMKAEMCALVGAESPRGTPDLLIGCDAYDTAYRMIFDSFPYCTEACRSCFPQDGAQES